MIEQDTIKLLRECDAGVKMDISSINEVIDYTHSEQLKQSLENCKTEHEQFADEMQTLLNRYSDEGKDPNPIAKGMSWIKTNVMLSVNDSDAIIADLMTDGCNMGVKSLSKYLNEYKAADEDSKNIAKRIITSENRLADEVRAFL